MQAAVMHTLGANIAYGNMPLRDAMYNWMHGRWDGDLAVMREEFIEFYVSVIREVWENDYPTVEPELGDEAEDDWNNYPLLPYVGDNDGDNVFQGAN
jgi:hypothetical protein